MARRSSQKPESKDSANPSSEPDNVRIDKWLWATRVYKTRPMATEACKRGQIKIAGTRCKPSRLVNRGCVIEVDLHALRRTVKVVDLLEKRVGAKLVSNFLEDLTPEAELERARRIRQENRLNKVFDEPGQGRPDKHQLREIQKFHEAQDAEGFDTSFLDVD